MTKNFIAFVACSVLIVLAWVLVQQQFPSKKPEKKDEIAQNKDEKKDKDVDPKVEPKVDPKVDPKIDPKVDPKVDPKLDPKIDDKPPEKNDIPAPAEVATYQLGDETSYLSVLLTNKGAGVQRLTMAKFETANYLGQPTKPPTQLEFICDDPFAASFTMFHFNDPMGLRPPVFGMESILWNVVEGGVVKDNGGWKIAFWTEVPDQRNLKVVKTYRLKPGDYHIGLSIEIENRAAEKAQFRYQLAGSHGLPNEGLWYANAAIFKNAVVGVVDENDSLTRSIEDSGRISFKQGGERVPAGNGWMQYAGVMSQYFASCIVVDHEQPSGDWKRGKSIIDWARPTLESTEVAGVISEVSEEGDVIRFTTPAGVVHLGKLLPRAREHMKTLGLGLGSKCVINISPPSSLAGTNVVVNWFRQGTTPVSYFDDITVRVNSALVAVPAGGKVGHNFLLYHGPVKTRLLGQMPAGSKVEQKLVDDYTYTLHLRTLTDYHMDNPVGRFCSFIGWTSLIIFCTNLMHSLLYWLHFISLGNWGLSVILLTIVVRGALYPISHRQALMSQKMQALAPEMKKIQEKHKGDKAAQSQATMELYRKNNVSPAGGCLPLFLQLPIMMGLYYCLQESVQFRLAEFLWIKNLAAPDMLFWWTENIPLISDPNNMGSAGFTGALYLGPFFNLLPIIAVSLMAVQQKYMAPPPQNEEQEMQQKTMQIMMIVMGVFFYKVAAGLCLYFIASSLWGVLERQLLPKKKVNDLAPATAEETANNSKPAMRSKNRRRDREQKKTEPETPMERLKAWWQNILDSAEKK